MSDIEIKVPLLPESVADATISTWHKKEGDAIKEGEIVVELETDKVMLEVPSPCDGVISSIKSDSGAIVQSDQILGYIQEGSSIDKSSSDNENSVAIGKDTLSVEKNEDIAISPAVRRLMNELGLDSSLIKGTGKAGRITKQDVESYIENKNISVDEKELNDNTVENIIDEEQDTVSSRYKERVAMTRIRATIADRLVESQQVTASLTTFNEVDLSHVIELRKVYKESFEKKHGVKLGFMSFFIKACCAALQQFPEVNASVDGKDIIYHNYCDVGVAVSTDKGLVVPVVKDAHSLSMADIEKQIITYAQKARSGKLSIDEMTGGTFSITNGGTFGSMLSTPILNLPQSAILGMHNIIKRPMVVDDKVVIRPMMYLALTYDHRIIDGSQSVRFLVMVKNMLENPARMLLQI